MPGFNHFPNCTCGWCRGGGGWRGGGSHYRAPAAPLPAVGTRTTWSCDDFCCPTTCPRCGAPVFFVRHNGGSVWFDELGPPWPKHACFFDDLTGIRLRTHLTEKARRKRPAFFGVVTETVVTEPGEKDRFVIHCSDGQVIDDEFNCTADLTKFPGSLVVIEQPEPELYHLHQVPVGNTVIEVWNCPRMRDILIYDPCAQGQTAPTESRFWLWGAGRWTELSDFNIQPRLKPLSDRKATRIPYEYFERRPPPPYPPGSSGPSIDFEFLFRSLQRGFIPTAPTRKPVEVIIFEGTPAERRFMVPGILSPERIAEWKREVEAIRGSKRTTSGENAMIELADLYAILRQAAQHGEIISYSDLSDRYFERTGQQHHWHGTWDAPLGQLNGITQDAGLPPISAIVTYRIDEDDPASQYRPPGDSFWGSPGVPPRPGNSQEREETWMAIVGRVHQATWPENLPGL